MLSPVISVLIIAATRLCEGSLFEPTEPDIYIQSHWDTLTIKRNVKASCECGKTSGSPWTTPWNLFVHAEGPTGAGIQAKTCLGTIVASNLVVTSHKCLLLQGKMRQHDVLKVNMRNGALNFAKVNDVTLTNTYAQGPNTKTFKIKEMIYNPRYGASSELKMFPENDLVILKADANFLAMQEFSPICVPFGDTSDIGNVTGYYYNLPTDLSTLPNETNAMFPHSGRIFEKRYCEESHNDEDKKKVKEMSFSKTICFIFDKQEEQMCMKIEGGPIVYMGPNKRIYLLGIGAVFGGADVSGFDASIGIEKIYASSIKGLAKFLEYHSDRGRQKSIWCKTAKLKLRKNAAPQIGPAGVSIRPWKNNPSLSRNASLDCVCGRDASSPVFRIVGGKESAPREYGWITRLLIGDGQGRAGLCGGSVINTRIILTAAHCIINDEKIKAKERVMWVKPEDIDARLNAHLRDRDPLGIKVEISAILFHPDYIQPRKYDASYFDYDVALLITANELPLAQRGSPIRPICLPEGGQYVDIMGKTSRVIGWGLLQPVADFKYAAKKLQEIDIPIIPLAECRSVRPNAKITDNFLCAGTLDKYHDASRGDSGGPLMIQDPTTNLWTVYGVVSHEQDNPLVGKTAALYTDVQKIVDFIDYHSMRVNAKWCKTS